MADEWPQTSAPHCDYCAVFGPDSCNERAPTLTEFLLARLAEDEARARAPLSDNYWQSINPARVLADVEAKRRIVEDWRSLAERLDDQGRPLHLYDPATSMLLKATEPWIRLLAAVYSDHPDYRADEWKP